MLNAVAQPNRQMYGPIDPQNDPLPPAIVFHGNDNALSIVRSLGRRSIPVYVLNERNSDVGRSRFARELPISTEVPFQTAAVEFLLGTESDDLAGAVLLAASDEALESITQHRDKLECKYRLDLSNPTAQQHMLDKLTTYQIAEKAGVPTPRFWEVDSVSDLERWRDDLVYPLIVKPVLSHLFQRAFKAKFIVAENFDQLLKAFQVANEADIQVLLLEMIPGPDSALCSYYTYIDEDATPLFDFTKKIIRRYPKNMGLATYHVTDHVSGIKDLALRLFLHAGLRGLANAEFKYDKRDDTFKLIECNARFTAANGLVTKAGIDLSSLVYNRLVGLPLPPLDHYRDNVTMWDAMRDFRAFRELQGRDELSFFGWLASIMRPHLFPSFQWTDPQPAIQRTRRRLRRR